MYIYPNEQAGDNGKEKILESTRGRNLVGKQPRKRIHPHLGDTRLQKKKTY